MISFFVLGGMVWIKIVAVRAIEIARIVVLVTTGFLELESRFLGKHSQLVCSQGGPVVYKVDFVVRSKAGTRFPVLNSW